MTEYYKISDHASKLLNKEFKFDLDGGSLSNDITSNTFIEKNKNNSFFFISREPILLCGLNFIEDYISNFFSNIKIKKFFDDGHRVKKNQKIAEINGNSRVILSLERTLLNFLQHLSSISTSTANLKSKMGDTKTQLLDTRKTTTGLRLLEKYATRIGGAINHRLNLKEKILLKDNHLVLAGGLERIMEKIVKKNIQDYQIECDNYEQTKKLIQLGCKHFLLDNMKVNEIKKCISLKKNKKIIFEISGGIDFTNIKNYSQLGADYISSSSMTNNPSRVDIGLDII